MENRDLSGDEVFADDLTWREQDILILLAERLTNREIACRLHLAESTVKDYVGRILSKLYVKNRREAVERAKILGLLEIDRKTTTRPRSNLPAETTPFVGRKDELEEIRRRLAETRLLTLLGPGGIGKTRLAIKAVQGIAADAVADFEDGVFFVSLAPILLTGDIIQTIAETLKFPIATHEDPKHQLLRYLRRKQLLLVLDNFEHLLDGVSIVNEMLQAAPAIKILVTSRERLRLQSEMLLSVGGLAFPNQADSKDALNSDAAALFVQSARKVLPGFDPNQADLAQIINICQIVGGMPLGIELAAAWLHILSVDEIVDELETGLDILSTAVRDTPDRHHSIQAVFDHSWSMLHPSEREIFMALSVFRGGFTREAAQQVAGASLQLLAGLVNKSFLAHDPDAGRFQVHGLLRQYAQKRLYEAPDASVHAQEAHAAYYAAFMGERWAHLKDSRQMQALAEIEVDIENVRAAWRFYLERRNIPQMWKFVKGFWQVYWVLGWNHAGMELFAGAVKVLQNVDSEEAIALRALAMAYQAYFMAWLDLAERGYALAKDSVKLLESLNNSEGLAFAYDSLGVNAYFLSQYSDEIESSSRMLKVVCELDDKWLLAFTLFAVSMGALLKQDYVEARRIAESTLKINEEIGDLIGAAMPLVVLGHTALAYGELEDARGFYLRCLKISVQTGFHYGIQTSSKYLGKVTLSLGKIAEAEKYLTQCLKITKEAGFVRDIINLFYEFARLRAAQGEPEQAAELLALVLEHPISYQTRMHEGRIRDSANCLLAQLEGKMPQDVYRKALERGRLLEIDQTVDKLTGP